MNTNKRKAKVKVSGVEITADRIVAKLVEMLVSQDQQIAALRLEQQKHFEMLAEIQPKLRDDGKVELRVIHIPTAIESFVMVQPIVERHALPPNEQQPEGAEGQSDD